VIYNAAVVLFFSVERLFDELRESSYMALDPFVVTDRSAVTVTAECQHDTKSFYSLIYMRRSDISLVSAFFIVTDCDYY